MSTIDLTPDGARRALDGIVRLDGRSDDDVVERLSRIVWGALCEPGDSVAGRTIAAVGAADALQCLLSGRWAGGVPEVSAGELADGIARWTPRIGPDAVAHALELARMRGVRHVAPGDPEWPVLLEDLGDSAPLGLWVRGDPRTLGADAAAALVGARASTSYGEHVAIELAADLTATGVTIVSGAAYGIDGAAHRAALAAGGQTLALLAGGVDRPYPAGHAGLLDRIAESGAVVSETLCGSAPTKWRFLARNRLIAALSEATVVVEAGWRSGSLNTAGHAASLGRALGAVPGPVTSGASAGCHRLLREFGATCITSAADVRELLASSHWTAPAGEPARGASARPPTDDTSRVRDALSVRAWREPLDIAVRSGMSPRDVQAHLGMMALSGEAETRGGRWRRVAAATAPTQGGPGAG